MDDFPAGPASPAGRRGPRITVVVPVFNGGRDLARCLRSLRESSVPDDCYELIVVDDGSTDDSAAVAEAAGARVIRQPKTGGPAAARNDGARAATTPIVFFLDADVAVHRDALARALARLDADPGLVALFGSYDNAPAAPGLVSRYRNLLHHYVHHQGTFVDDARPVLTFWTGCGAIRREAFLDHGGFDPGLYRRPAIEDIELGYRITRGGGRIVLARDVLATHLKRWTLPSVVRTDIFQRGVPWMLLILRSKVGETDLNVDATGRISVAATGLGGLAALAALAWPPMLLAAAACLGLIAWTNRRFYRFLARTRGVAFAAGCLPLHLIYFACCGLAVAIAAGLWYGGLARVGRLDAAGAAARGLRVDPAESASPHNLEGTPAAAPESSTSNTARSARWPH